MNGNLFNSHVGESCCCRLCALILACRAICRYLELHVVESYCNGLIGAGEVGQLLGFSSRWETYNFLQQERAEPPYTEDDLELDRAALHNLLV